MKNKNNSKITSLFIMCAVIFAVIICIDTSVFAAEKDNCDIEIEYSLPNGYTYSITPALVDSRVRSERVYPAEKFVIEFVYVLPASVEGKNVRFSDEVTIKNTEGDVLRSGTDITVDEGLYLMDVQEKEYVVRFMYTSGLPQLYITIDQEAFDKVNLDKNNRAEAHLVITDGITTEYSGALEYIKGRGNGGWTRPQKPYNIKLASKSNLFGMGAAKKYSLLANYDEYSCIKNKVALEFADKVGIEYTSGTQQVDVYINNKFAGNYLLTEPVEVRESRINIFDIDELNEFFNPQIKFETPQLMGDLYEDAWEKRFSYRWTDLKNQAAADINGGYLLELEMGGRYRDDPDDGFVSGYGQPVIIKTPEYASQQQVEYIRDYYQKFEDALISDDGYNSEGKHYSEYIDVESFAKMYVFQEYVQNLDAGITSCFMYKDLDGKLKAGPVWDMDKAIACPVSRNNMTLNNPENIWVADSWRFAALNGRTVFSLLWTHTDFRQAAMEQWNEFFAPNIEGFSQNIVDSSKQTVKSVIASQYVCKNAEFAPTLQGVEDYYYEILNSMLDYADARAEFMSVFLSENSKSVKYNSNGGYGVTLDPHTYLQGETATVADTEFTRDNAVFTGWNTKADGSGQWYNPGDKVIVDDENIILYAQWQGDFAQTESPAATQPQHEISIFRYFVEKLKNLF